MSHSNPLILQVHIDGAGPYEIGDEIWQQPLADAIRAEAETMADYAGPGLLPLPGRLGRVALRNHVLIEMTAALQQAGDTYKASDGVAYTLTDEAQRMPIDNRTVSDPRAGHPRRLCGNVRKRTFGEQSVGGLLDRGFCSRLSRVLDSDR